jgi:Ulp1 family protease
MLLLTISRSLEFGEGRQRAIVHFDDLPRLDEEEFLNDSLIDFYMMYVGIYLAIGTANLPQLPLQAAQSPCR